MKKLIIASHNQGKVREIGELLAPLGLEVVSAAALNLPEPEETGDSFHANAALKSLAAAQVAGLPALADDSGLCVAALAGAPGIYSARWAGAQKDFTLAMERIRTEIEAKGASAEGAVAYFVCVLSLAFPYGREMAFEGRIEGRLTFPPRGASGCGYDPIFVPDGYDFTFAEMDAEHKHRISHRSRAFAKLIHALNDEASGIRDSLLDPC
jgi:XTP/dITP diphosphohydrolase